MKLSDVMLAFAEDEGIAEVGDQVSDFAMRWCEREREGVEDGAKAPVARGPIVSVVESLRSAADELEVLL